MLDEDELPTPAPSPPRVTRRSIGSALQVLGAGFVSIAAFDVSMIAGFLTLGGCLIVYGVATELGGR